MNPVKENSLLKKVTIFDNNQLDKIDLKITREFTTFRTILLHFDEIFVSLNLLNSLESNDKVCQKPKCIWKLCGFEAPCNACMTLARLFFLLASPFPSIFRTPLLLKRSAFKPTLLFSAYTLKRFPPNQQRRTHTDRPQSLKLARARMLPCTADAARRGKSATAWAEGRGAETFM